MHPGTPKIILNPREYKSVVTDRVLLVPGPADEIATVRWIFRQFVNGKLEHEIAKMLNEQGMPSEHDRPWTTQIVRAILTHEKYIGTHEKYIGNNVWNRHSQRLHTRRTRNPCGAWVMGLTATTVIGGVMVIASVAGLLLANHRSKRVETSSSSTRKSAVSAIAKG